VEELLSGIPALQWVPLSDAEAGQTPSDPLFHPRASLRLIHAKGTLGTAGMLHPTVARSWDLEREEACLFQIDLDLLAQADGLKAQFAPFSVFPQSSRDLSILVGAAARYGDVLKAVREAGAAELRDVELVDKFSGPGVPADKQSLTVRLHFGLADRTLKDSEVATATERILAELQRRHGASLRS
jgi:phenylalanyl-tRNA synthetase beta chain